MWRGYPNQAVFSPFSTGKATPGRLARITSPKFGVSCSQPLIAAPAPGPMPSKPRDKTGPSIEVPGWGIDTLRTE
jgi:hypothetical protein